MQEEEYKHRIDFRSASFHANYTDADQSDVKYQPQVAFMGRSNAGKSSLLNALCDNKKLARTSNSPGRTQTIVMFSLTEPYYLADLPGYGYAKTSKTMRASWKKLVELYVKRGTARGSEHGLLGLVIAVDSRRLLQDMDVQMIDFATFYRIEICVFLTKMDKLNQQQRAKALRQTQEELKDYDNVSVMMGSSTPKKQGVDQLINWISKTMGTS